MSAKFRTTGRGTGYGSWRWPVLLSLLLVLLPTAGVLWFLSEAVRNERLAFRQKLVEAYRDRLPALRDRFESYWRRQAEALATAGTTPGAAAFAACVGKGLADSVVCYDAAGQVLYPAPAGKSEEVAEDGDWAEASRLEHAEHEPGAAAAAYGRITAKTSDERWAARALQAEARCPGADGTRGGSDFGVGRHTGAGEVLECVGWPGAFDCGRRAVAGVGVDGRPHADGFCADCRAVGEVSERLQHANDVFGPAAIL